jgi:hypothetical protein
VLCANEFWLFQIAAIKISAEAGDFGQPLAAGMNYRNSGRRRPALFA